MASDGNLILQTSVTKTATFNGSTVDLATRLACRGLYAWIKYSAAADADGDDTATAVFSVDHSDNDSDWFTHASGAADTVALTSSATTGEVYIPIKSDKRYLRLTVTIAGGGMDTTPTITYSSQIVLTKP